MDAVAVVLRKHLGEVGLQVLGRLLRVDGLLAARVGVDAREDVGQGDVVASVNIEISDSALTLAVAEAFIRRPSINDSTITPRVDCATYL